MRKGWIILMLLIGGCVTEHPAIPGRYHLSVPCAEGGTGDAVKVWATCPQGHATYYYTNMHIAGESVYLNQPFRDGTGNSYTMRFFVMTNNNSTLPPPDDPLYDTAVAHAAYLATNRWPNYRQHFDLSLDGGSNYTRRIGYGVQRDPSRVGGEFIWSPPNDTTLLTEHAVIRMTDLDGRPFDNGSTNYPFNLPPGQYVKSYEFAIRGGYVTSPAEYDFVYTNAEMTVSFFQTGGGEAWEVAWLTPADPYAHPLVTLSNCLGGVVNSTNIICTIPAAPEVRLLVRSCADPALSFQSKSFSVEP